MQDTGQDERLTVATAADRLGISKEAVRKRIARGTLRADKDPDGTVRVYIPATATPSGTAGSPELVEELRDQVRYLRTQLDQERDANRENRRIIAALTARIPELPPASAETTSQEPRESPTAATEQPGRVGPQPAVESTQEPREESGMHMPEAGGGPLPHDQQRPSERPWWRRLFRE